MAFGGGRLKSGFDLFAQKVNLKRCLRAADLVITGEGAIDSSTFMGKAAGEVAGLCGALGLPCLALAGVTRGKWANTLNESGSGFALVRTLTELTSFSEAQARAAIWLERLAREAAREYGPKIP